MWERVWLVLLRLRIPTTVRSHCKRKTDIPFLPFDFSSFSPFRYLPSSPLIPYLLPWQLPITIVDLSDR